MTFAEFIQSKATWFDRLVCVVRGHDWANPPWFRRSRHPCDEAEDRRPRADWRTHCCRCGVQ